MIKVINKKVLGVLLTLVLTFCWFAVPASAAEIDDEADYCAAGVEVISVTPLGEVSERSIYSNLLNRLDVFAAKKLPDGSFEKYTINSDYPLTEKGPANILNCYLPDGYYQTMINNDLDYFYCELTFTVKGTDLRRYTLTVNGEVKANTSVTQSSQIRVGWICDRKETVTFDVAVYDKNNVSAVSWGHIYK